MHRSAHSIPFLLVALFLLTAGAACQREQGSSASPGPEPTAPSPIKRPPPAALSLPTLRAPRPLPAERVVHLVYSSNAAGEAEPCG